MSILNDILDAVVVGQNTLALAVDGVVVQAVKRKLPKREQPVDLDTQVSVSGSERVDQVKRIAFGSRFQVQYRIEITLITPGERDAAINLGGHTDWREATRAAWVKPGALAAAGVKRVEIVDAPFLNRSELAAGYDYNQVVLDVTTYEDRS